MNGFYISKITIQRNGYRESTIQLKDGLNIITGPSNTGKSLILECIDFIFGSEENLASDINFDKVIIEIQSRKSGSAILSRELNEKLININNSSIENLNNGDYKLKGDNSIGVELLKLIGITSPVKLYAKDDYTKKNSFSWRSIKNFFFISETEIITDKPFFHTETFPTLIFSLGCLQYLINGTERKAPEGLEDPKHIEIKKTVLVNFITQKINELENRENELKDELQRLNSPDVEKIIKEQSSLLTKISKELGEKLINNLALEEQRNQLLTEINELDLLIDRLKELETQYVSDIERLKFIIDGENIRKGQTPNTKCPYCESPIQPKQHKTYIITETKELEKIKINLQELQETIKANETDKKEINDKLESLSEEYSKNIQTVSNLQTKVQTISSSISEYEKISKLQQEIEFINSSMEHYKQELQNIENAPTQPSITFDVKSEFKDDFFEEIEKSMDEIIQKTDYENYQSIKIDRKTLDLLINDKPKKNQGKGYRAFLNSLYAHSLTKYLAQKAKYSPGFLFLDSPLLSLKETEEKESSSNSMKIELMNAFMDDSFERQTIIVENTIPEINYSQANLIKFTQEKNNGRYGFIIEESN